MQPSHRPIPTLPLTVPPLDRHQSTYPSVAGCYGSCNPLIPRRRAHPPCPITRSQRPRWEITAESHLREGSVVERWVLTPGLILATGRPSPTNTPCAARGASICRPLIYMRRGVNSQARCVKCEWNITITINSLTFNGFLRHSSGGERGGGRVKNAQCRGTGHLEYLITQHSYPGVSHLNYFRAQFLRKLSWAHIEQDF